MKLKIIAIVLPALLSACTSVTVRPVDAENKLTHVCIEENPKVIVSDFVGVVEDEFQKHLITTEIYRGATPRDCEYKLTYTANQKWDLATYLVHAELNLYKGNLKVGYAEYHLRGGGGFSLMKWMGVRSKMAPVIDELLEKV